MIRYRAGAVKKIRCERCVFVAPWRETFLAAGATFVRINTWQNQRLFFLQSKALLLKCRFGITIFIIFRKPLAVALRLELFSLAALWEIV
jgi:hypothetical protein